MTFDYDIIVIGAGHAGCECAVASARLGARTLLITIDMNKVAQMSCNPAVGGIAKGQIVREIDALGGQMGIITDRASIQFRMLNRSKGPAMWSPRAQCDRMVFSALWRQTLENTPNLYLWQDDANQLVIDSRDGKPVVCGVRTRLGATFTAKKVVLTAGTFLNGLMHVGRVQTPGGRVAEPASSGLTEQLRDLGLATARMKTGTPPRLDGRTIDWSKTTPQPGDDAMGLPTAQFSYLPTVHRQLKQRDCYTIQTNERTHQVLRQGLPDSPLYNGQIQSIGPRYCPSIETKIVTFANKTEHHLFLEPEGETTHEYYINGFSSSLPLDIQVEALHTIDALKDVHLYRPGYAIEYDFFDPTQLHHSLESKVVGGLYMAGQVNGTTGYEEAAGQGLMAGINAARAIAGQEPIVLGRDQAYIGVLIDDLVMKGVDEPYRMFTSRAEYRILLRQDNADVRLTPLGYEIGLATAERMAAMQAKAEQRDAIIGYVRATSVRPEAVKGYLQSVGSAPIAQPVKVVDLLLRPNVTLAGLAATLAPLAEALAGTTAEAQEAAEIQLKYQGYIDRERAMADKLHRLEEIRIRADFDYESVQAISTEARQKLARLRPATIGQASRIPGVSPSDINVLLLLHGR